MKKLKMSAWVKNLLILLVACSICEFLYRRTLGFSIWGILLSFVFTLLICLGGYTLIHFTTDKEERPPFLSFLK